MKKIIILSTIILNSVALFSQNDNEQGNNEKLYQAIVKENTTLIKQLLKNGADPNFIKTSGPWMKVNMLITAVNNGNIDIVRMLIEVKADVTWKDGFKTTALMYAASKGNKDLVILLLDNGADINDSDGQGNTVLSAAKESNNKELIRLIEAKLKEKT